MRAIFAALLLLVMPLQSEQVYCQRPVANLCAEPNDECEVESQLVYGAPAELLLEQSDGWAQVRMRDGYEGWVAPGTLFHPPEVMLMIYYPKGRVRNLFCNVYRTNDITPYPPLMTLPMGVVLDVVQQLPEQNFRWIQVRLLDGSLAWVQRGDLAIEQAPLTLAQMLQVAERLVGLPYTWGGVSTFGFDCSGLVQTLYGMMGIDLPRNARDQMQAPGMVAASLEQLDRGDLIFFCNSKRKVVHVGIYLGEKKFLHANASAGNPVVLVSDVRDPLWKQLYPSWKPMQVQALR